MPEVSNLFLENKAWVKEKLTVNPRYFEELAKDQTPIYLWIGCSDSRVLPNEITGTTVGEVFTHRNIANMVVDGDLNLECVVEYALKYLKIQHVIVCGHYGCGGVKASMDNNSYGVIDKWLLNIKKIFKANFSGDAELASDSFNQAFDNLVELNVIQQVENFIRLYGKLSEHLPQLFVHGWVYDMKTGYLKSLVKKKL